LKCCGEVSKYRSIDCKWRKGIKERKLESYSFKVVWLAAVRKIGRRVAEKPQFRTLCVIKYDNFTF
jgi:hypothetical protein